MQSLLFTHSYFYKFDAKQWSNKQPYPPLGTITAAAFLREKGYDTQLFDTNLADSPENILPAIKANHPDFLIIYDDGFNYLTKMCLTHMRQAAFDLIKIGKANHCKVLVSSSDSSDHYSDYLEKGADVILIGEAEFSLLEVLKIMEDDKSDLSTVPGIAFLHDNQVVKTKIRPVFEDLDSIPRAAWDLIDIDRYRKIWMDNHGYFSLNLATTRGCPFSCNWCAKPIFGQKYNSRSPENVVDEIAYLMQTYKATHFWICDDIFGLKPGWVNRFRDLVLDKKLRFKYTMQSRVDVMLKDNGIEALAQSGLDIVWVGAESGSQKILDAMDKGIKVEQIYEARKKLKDHGVRVAFFLQFGYPGELLEDILLTEKMLFELMPDDMGISVSYPLPGTPFHEKVKSQLSEKANWTDSDDLALMFKNTYSPGFYKSLHRYIHKKFRKKQSAERIQQFLLGKSKNIKGLPRTLVAFLYYILAVPFYKSRLLSEQNKFSDDVR